jgi:hypothetical protein
MWSAAWRPPTLSVPQYDCADAAFEHAVLGVPANGAVEDRAFYESLSQYIFGVIEYRRNHPDAKTFVFIADNQYFVIRFR